MTYCGAQTSPQSSEDLINPFLSASKGSLPVIDPEPEDIYEAEEDEECRVYISDAYYDEVPMDLPPPNQARSSASDQLSSRPTSYSPSPPTSPHRTLGNKLSHLLSHRPHFRSHWGADCTHARHHGVKTRHKGTVKPEETESTTQILSCSIPSTYSNLLSLEEAQQRDDIVHRPEGFEMSRNGDS